MNYLKLLFFIGLVTTFTKSEAQLVDKIGGVCFRIDDTQSPNNLKALDSIFSKHGKRFTYAPNTQIANFTQCVPDQYPLSMNSLVSACNQSSSRDPVMTLDEHEVDAAVSTLKAQGCARIVHPTHGRGVVRVRQVFDEKFALEAADAAVMGVLLVRGPQTAAELRTRTERLHNFDNVADVDTCLHQLAERQLVQLIERQHGQKEQRWQQLVADEAEQSAAPAESEKPGASGTE